MKLTICFLISLIAVLVIMPGFIGYLKRMSLRQSVSEYSLEDDQKKAGTPIMGGILFIMIPCVVSLIASPELWKHGEIWILVLSFVGYGLIGFTDDYLIAIKKNNKGLTPKQKLAMQVGLAVVFFLLYRSNAELSVTLPLTKHSLNLGWGYFILVLLMFSGASNAVNLTDGMDGLAAGCSVSAVAAFFVIACVKKCASVQVLSISLIGGLLGYLYYNKKPARVFMGDTGALSLGGVMAAMAMIMKVEIPFIIIAGIFVIETLCVIIQQVSVRTGHGKVFVYTPIHYAFRIKGMEEKNIVRMFWLAELGFAILGLWLALI